MTWVARVSGTWILRAVAIWPAPTAYAGVSDRRLPVERVIVAALCVTLSVAACGGVAAKDIPPTGQIWFGQSFDPTTFALTGQRSTVGTQEPVALVAHLTKPIDTSTTIRASLNGQFVTAAPVTVTGGGEIFGTVLGALQVAGQWRYDIVDVGGNVLASGTVTAT